MSDPLSDLLSQFSSRLAAVEANLGLEGGAAAAAPAAGGAAAPAGDKPAVVAYDALVAATMPAFKAAADALGPATADLVSATGRRSDCNGRYLTSKIRIIPPLRRLSWSRAPWVASAISSRPHRCARSPLTRRR